MRTFVSLYWLAATSVALAQESESPDETVVEVRPAALYADDWTWVPLRAGSPSGPIVALGGPGGATNLVFAVDPSETLWKSADNGKSWEAVFGSSGLDATPGNTSEEILLEAETLAEDLLDEVERAAH